MKLDVRYFCVWEEDAGDFESLLTIDADGFDYDN
jgi:hypothetical protein